VSPGRRGGLTRRAPESHPQHVKGRTGFDAGSPKANGQAVFSAVPVHI
jgi:hypothetical protein